MRNKRVEVWLAAFKVGWEALSPQAIADLFSSHVAYQASPHQEPQHGVAAVQRHWVEELEEVDSATVEFAEPLVDDDRVAVEYETTIENWAGTRVDNGVLVLEFADGLCTSLREYWMITEGVSA